MAANLPDPQRTLELISQQWDADIVPQLVDYIRIPAKSPSFDAQWEQHGHIEAAIQQAHAWVARQQVPGLTLKIVRLQGRTPVLFFDLPATGGASAQNSVLLYGHLDKQPEMVGWRDDGGPWTPLYEDGRLYGRGGADDGYAVFAALSAIMALDAQGVARPRCVGVIETCEESGSYDLPAYLDTLAPRMGNVQLVIALDSGCGNYDQLWATTSLRGLVNGTLTVKVLNEGVHSGDAGGIVPSSFRVARALLDRVDDARTGTVGAPAFQCEIPPARTIQARQAAEILGDALWQRFPWASCASGQGELVQPPTRDKVELILNRTWRASLSVIGADGLPPTASAGNVLRPETVLKLSLRIPPAVDGATATRALKQILESDPPHNADVRFDADTGATGWNAPEFAPWLAESLNEASLACYGKPTAYMGEGGTIPFMGMLGAKFPAAQILVTGVLGPKSNAHGPNEFLHVPYAKRLCAVIALTMAACARQG